MNALQNLIEETRKRLEGRVTIFHGNRLEASGLWNLLHVGAVPQLSYAFTSVAGNARDLAEQVFALEDYGNFHPDLVWGDKGTWEALERVVAKYPDAILMPAYRKPGHEELQKRYPDLTLLCPPVMIAAGVENKGSLANILEAADVSRQLMIPEVLYEDAANIPTYWDIVDLLQGAREFVIQILASAGGARHDLKSSISVVSNELDLQSARSFQAGHGACKVAAFIRGQESNGAAVATPWGTYIDDPSHKAPGLKELHGRSGSGAGNDWTFGYSKAYLNLYLQTLMAVGDVLSAGGFNGVFGMDNIFDPYPRPHELNGRAQGTTEAQERSSIRLGLPPLTLLALAQDLGVPQEVFPSPLEYNMLNTGGSDGWYLKVNMPDDAVISENLNGLWTLAGDKLFGHRNEHSLDMFDHELYIYAAPQAGKTARAGTALPTLYINGWLGTVFTAEHTLTDFGHRVVSAVYKKMGVEI